MYSQSLKSLCRVLALTCVAVMPVALAAQDAAKTTNKATSEY